MFRLAEQIGGDPVRIIAAIGDDQDFRWTGNGVDADLAEHFAFGGGDIGIAGADNLVDRGNGLGAISQRGNGLRAADAVNLGDAGALVKRAALMVISPLPVKAGRATVPPMTTSNAMSPSSCSTAGMNCRKKFTELRGKRTVA